MAPQSIDRRVATILDFAEQTRRSLQERSSMPARQDLDANIKLLPSLHPGAQAKELDRLGADLWNVANGIVVEDEPPEIIRVGVRVRVFALLLLDAALRAAPRRAKDVQQRIRIMRISIRASRLCLEKTELDLAMLALEICAQHSPPQTEAAPLMQLSRGNQSRHSDQDEVLQILANDLLLLRLCHAWKSDRMDLADHFFAKIDLPKSQSTLALRAADLYFEISTCLSRPERLKEILIWSDRAFAVLVALAPEALTPEVTELLLSIGISLVDDLLLIGSAECRRRAYEVCDLLSSSHGLANRITIMTAKVRMIITEQRVDAKQLTAVLQQIIKTAILTEGSFTMIMQTLHKAAKASCSSALPALKTLLCLRLLPELESTDSESDRNCEWIEKAIVTYTHLMTTHFNERVEGMLDDLRDLLDRIHASRRPVLSTKATHAAQTLLWKSIGDRHQESPYAWYKILRHPSFQNAGNLNKARIGRKLMRLAMDDGNVAVAREVFLQMPTAAQNEPLSRYMAFKLALQTSDEELATTSLGIIVKTTSKDPTYTYACVLASQQSAMRHMTLVALQAILDQRPQGIHLPSLLRCTAGLLTAELRSSDEEQYDLVEVVKIFETAANCIDDLRQTNQWRAEVQWWSKNTYNLAIRMCGKTNPEHLLRLLDVCIQFLEAYPNDAILTQQDDVVRRQMLCNFLAAAALIVMGRGTEQKGNQYTLQCYLHAQQRIQVFRKLYEKLKDTDVDRETLDSRAFAMLKFDLECILRLQQWNQLGKALQACLDTPGVGRWDAMADLLIITHRELDGSDQDSHVETMTQLLQRIINDSWRREKDIAKVARWLRFTVTLCLDHEKGDFGLKLLQQAASMAENGSRNKHEAYPESELQWLAATGFNHAVDLLGAGQAVYLAWMDAALEIARWSQDNGALHAIFSSKRNMAIERERQMLK